MATILKRTVFYDDTGGVVRFRDFAIVTTTLGKMIEPFVVNNRTPLGADRLEFDPEDEMVRIDAIERIDAGRERRLMSDSSPALHGFITTPRVGR